jgi:hypothetical protein
MLKFQIFLASPPTGARELFRILAGSPQVFINRFARTLLILAVRLGASCVRVFRFGSGRALRTDWGCVLRTASASIACISPLFLFRLRTFPRQPLGLQSFIIFPEGFLRFFVFRCRLLYTGALKSPSHFSLFECEVLPYFIAHRSPLILVTSEMTIARQRRPARKPAD